jgi:hypothetical protein
MWSAFLLLYVVGVSCREIPLSAQFDPSICAPFVWTPSSASSSTQHINASYVLSLTSSTKPYLDQLFHHILHLTKFTSLPISIIVVNSLPKIVSLVQKIDSFIHSHGPTLISQIKLYQFSHPLEKLILRPSYLRLLHVSSHYSNLNEFFKLAMLHLPYERLLYLHPALKILKPLDHLLACSAHSDVFFTNSHSSFFERKLFVVRGGDESLFDDMIHALLSYTWDSIGSMLPYQTAFQEFLYFYFVRRPSLPISNSSSRSPPSLRVHRLSSCLYNFQKFPESLCLPEYSQHLYSSPSELAGTASGVSPYVINQPSTWLQKQLSPSLPPSSSSSSSSSSAGSASISSFNPHHIPIHKPCRPNFWIIGARKSGTTALYTWLTEHPHVAPLNIRHEPTDGETMIPLSPGNLVRYNKLYQDELLRYQQTRGGGGMQTNQSSGERQEQEQELLVGDAWVGRFLNEDYRAIAKVCRERNLKILLILRDPIERCVSQWKMRYRREISQKTPQQERSTSGETAHNTLTAMGKSGYDINALLEKELREYLFHATAAPVANSTTNPKKKRRQKTSPRSSDLFSHSSPTVTAAPALPLIPSSLNSWKGSENCVYEGMYSVHLRRWLVVHGIDHLRVYFTDDLEKSPREVITDALRFIGVPDTSVALWKYDPIRHSRRSAPNRDVMNVTVPLTGDLRKRLETVFGVSNRELERLLGIDRVPWGY